MKILITGACGFIGGHASSRFLQEGADVVGLDNLSRPGSYHTLQELQAQPRFTFCHADIRSASEIQQVFSQRGPFDLVIHAAGQVAVTTSVIDPRSDFEINAVGTLNILEATRTLSPKALLIFTSTNKVYGKLDDLEVEESDTRYQYTSGGGVAESRQLDFHTPYGCSKGSAEQYVRDFSRIFGLETVVFRQSCIYGTRQFGLEDQGWVAWFVIAATLGREISIYGDGKQVRDLLWVEDLVEAFYRASQNRNAVTGKIFNVGGGAENSLSILELLGLMRSNGLSVAPRMAQWRPGDQKVFVCDTSLIQTALDWRPSVSPETGVARLCDWVKAEKDVLLRVLAAIPAANGGFTVPRVTA